jgi:hypothetical protein
MSESISHGVVLAPFKRHRRTERHAPTRWIQAKSIGGVWVPDDFSGRWSTAVRKHRLRDLQRQLALTELEMTIFEISSRT